MPTTFSQYYTHATRLFTNTTHSQIHSYIFNIHANVYTLKHTHVHTSSHMHVCTHIYTYILSNSYTPFTGLYTHTFTYALQALLIPVCYDLTMGHP